jgi:hypothetical protein
MTPITDGDVARALIVLPSPLFRPADIYAAAVLLGFAPSRGQSLWNALIKRGLIVRTGIPIGLAARRFYWQRTPGSESACS